MSSFNKVILMGNLSRDCSLKFLPSNTALCEFGIAMNRKFKTGGGEQRDEVCFVDCVVFGKQAEVVNQYFHKGSPILIEGRLTFSAWEDKNGGGKRSKLTVTVENFQFVGSRDSGDGGQQKPRAGQRSEPQSTEQQGGGFDEESIPFDHRMPIC